MKTKTNVKAGLKPIGKWSTKMLKPIGKYAIRR